MYPLPNLPPRLSREIFAAVRRGLPPAHDATPDALDARDMIAMAAIAALDPRDAAEAVIAAQVVMAEAHGRASLEDASLNGQDLKVVMQCRAQARAMMRQAQDSLRGLQRLQATRPVAEPVEIPVAPAADRTDADTARAEPGSAGAPSRGAAAIKPRPAAAKPYGSDRPVVWPWTPPAAALAQAARDCIADRDSETNSALAAAGSSRSHAFGG